jgi:NADH-quinone oxidoreductase subunit N
MNVEAVLLAMSPEHILLAGLLLLIVLEIGSARPAAALPLSLISLLAAGGFALWLFASRFSAAPFPGQYSVASAGYAAKAVLLLLCAPVLLMAKGELRGFKFHALLLSSLYGAMLLLGARSFLILFLALELMSVPVYVLVLIAFKRADSAEAALKYLVLGGTASAMLLMGVALIFGYSGSMSVEAFADALGSADGWARTGVGLIIAALFLKAAVVPFHAWAPDVYEGASIPVTAFMATVVKAAVLFAALRLFGETALSSRLAVLMAVLPLASIVWGNLAAMRQSSFKRMIAYSSIAHAGYLFYAFLDAGPDRFASVVFYLLAYGLLNLLAFAAILPDADDARRDELESFKGLYSRHPFSAIAIAVAMLSLAGIPPLPGFAAKFFIFRNVLAAGHTAYAVAGLVASYLGIYFYLRVIQIMFMENDAMPSPGERVSLRPLAIWACGLCLLGTLALSVFPGWFIGGLAN